ncbi:MAG TPA: hypothetical protein VGA75_07885 [Paracoccaceae bacterium]
MIRSLCLASLTLAFAGVSGCAGEGADPAAQHPVYGGIETILLDGDLVNFRVAMRGARSNEDVAAYARCAAAQYALIRGFGFARHVRTNVAQDNGNWRGDAVYTISSALPRGLKTIDAEVTVRDCGEQGIPTV